MIKLINILNEILSYNILYHYTEDNESLLNIINSNKLTGPVSLTRDKNSFVKYWKDKHAPILVLNKDKLKHNYKLKPFMSNGEDSFSKLETNEMEEIIYKTVINLDKYIIKIILKTPNNEIESLLKEKNIKYEIK